MEELVLKITASKKSIAALVQALETIMFQARIGEGYVDCRLFTEIGDPRSFCYVEQWATLEDMESQIRSNRFGKLLATMETAPVAPSLKIRTISEERGLDNIKAIRLGP
jgi:quinol monooxygenase YgiN